MLTDQAISVIRTLVPYLWGKLATWLTVATGIVVPAEVSDWVIYVLEFLFSGLIYMVVRLLEERWPKLGWLLGYPKPPVYNYPTS